MSNKIKSAGSKFLSVFLSAATAVAFSGGLALAPIAAQAAALTPTQVSAIVSLLQSFGADSATIANVQASLTGGTVTPPPATGGTKCTFTRPLTVGSTGEDVMCLQKYLNSAGFVVAQSGAGSVGSESTYFGSRTQAAVSKWQAANGVSPTAGYFGSLSQAKYNTLVAGGGTTPPPGGTPPPAAGGSGLTVSAASSQPAATLAVQSAINVPFTKVRFTASADGDVTVSGVTVERTGLMNDAALSGIILLDESGNRIGLSKTLNSNHQAVLDGFVIPRGTTREFTVAGDMNSSLSSYSGQVGFIALNSVNAGSATVSCSCPITGAGQTINSTLTVGTVTLTKGANDPNASNTKEIGTKAYVFTAIKATAGSAEDMQWRSIRFNQSGSVASGDLANVVVVDSTTNTTYNATVSSDGKYYTAVFNPALSMKKGESREVFVKADIVNGSSRGIDFDVYRYSDVVFRGSTFGYDIQPTATNSGDSSTDDDGTFQNTNPVWDAYETSIGGGSLRVEAANDTVTSQNIVSGGTSVPLGGFRIEAKGEPVTFTSWVVTMTTTRAAAVNSNEPTSVTVYDENGAAVAGPRDITGSTVTFTDSVTVPTGIHTYTVKGNLDSNWGSNDTIYLSFNAASAITSVTGQTTGNAITPTPNSTVQGSTMTVKSGGLTVTPATSLASQNVIAPSTNVELGRFTLDAGASGDDLRVTSAQIRMISTAASTNITGLKLMDGTTQLNTGSNVLNPSGNSTATLTFTLDNNLVIPKQTSKTLTLMGNISSTATSGGTVRFDFSSGSPDWAVSTKGQGSTVAESLTTSVNGATLTIRGGGGYSVAIDASSPTEQWVPAGSTGQVLNVIRFTGTSEDIAVTDLRLQIDTTGSSTGADFAALELWDGATLLQRKAPVAFTAGVEDFQFPQSGTGAFIIPKDSFKRLTVKADLATICTSCSGKAGQLVGVDFDGAGTPASIGKNKAIGKQSGIAIHSSTVTDTAGSGVVSFLSIPTVTRVNLSSSDLVSGTQDLYKFSVKADPKYDVAINRFSFKIATTGVTQFATTLPGFQVYVSPNSDMSNSKIMNVATGSVAAYFSPGVASANYDSSHNLIVRVLANNTSDYSNSWVTIPAGQTYYFALKGAVTTDGTGDSISTTLLGDTARPVNVILTGGTNPAVLMGQVTSIDLEQSTTETTGVLGNAATSTNFIWSDFSADNSSSSATHSVTSHDWMNGFKVPGLPTTGLTSSVLAN